MLAQAQIQPGSVRVRCNISCKGMLRTAAQQRVVARQAVIAPEAPTQTISEDVSEAKPRVHMDGIMMQGFNWESHKKHPWYHQVAHKIPDLQAAGVSHLWLPPPSQSVSPEGYMPGQLYKLDSHYGNEQQLKELLAKLKDAGIDPLADIVINHRCADTQDEKGRWNNYHDDIDHDGHNIDWGRWAITCNDHEFGGKGNPDTGDDFWGAPDLDHTNQHLREALVYWMQHLRDNIGYRGWRFDFAKGYGSTFIKQYVVDSGAGGDMNVGEFWSDMHWEDGGVLAYNQDHARQRICNWLDGHNASAAAFDFPTKGILQYAVDKCEYWRLADSNNKPSGLLGWWPSKSVTFVDNHDTGSTQAHWPFPRDKVGQGYAYILTHPGMPCIFWDHFFEWGDLRKEIESLLQARKNAGIGARAKVEILAAEQDMYVSRTTGSLGSLILKLGPKYDMGALCPNKNEGWRQVAKGKNFCVWLKPNDAAASSADKAASSADKAASSADAAASSADE